MRTIAVIISFISMRGHMGKYKKGLIELVLQYKICMRTIIAIACLLAVFKIKSLCDRTLLTYYDYN